MKLEIQHLAAYLPYKLQVKYNKSSWEICNLTRLGMMYLSRSRGHHYYSETAAIEDVKPILRSLYELIPNEHGYKDIGHLVLDVSTGQCSTVVFQTLCKNHYDVFNLVNNGLAINVNTLTINPYENSK